MKNWKEVEIPNLMKQHCKLDKRGLPIPYVVLVDKNNQSHFKINDDRKTNDCILNNKCSICGEIMNLEDKWLIGGPRSALHKNGAYIDIPTHKECGLYALQVCPYLAYSGYNAATDIELMQKKIAGGESIKLVNPTIDSNRVPLFVFVRISSYKINITSKYIYPDRPFKEIEYWNDGVQLEQNEALIIINNYSQKYQEENGTNYI